MKKAELVLIPLPGVSHLTPMVEIGKLLINRNDSISITVFIMKLPSEYKSSSYIDSLLASSTTDHRDRIRFIELPSVPIEQDFSFPLLLDFLVQTHKPYVKESVRKLTESFTGSDSPRLAGFVLDMFCTSMIDVANEFGVPSYVFFATNAVFLDLILHLQDPYFNKHKGNISELWNSVTELKIPSLINPIPVSVLPNVVLDKDWASWIFYNARNYKDVKGILVNTFTELESSALSSFSHGKIPHVYPVGPILNLKNNGSNAEKSVDIMSWLDHQPPSSVVFLCFGGAGSFDDDQVKEIARGLKQSGVRFIWALRKAPPKGKFGMPTDYTNPNDALPEGFLERTAGIGKVIGWAPQVEILAHKATGGFISHCGWNSVLESLWFGVPIGAWPLYSEQQLNAFAMVVELGLAVEIKMDYRNVENPIMVSAEEIESGIRKLMDGDSEIKKKVKDISEKSRKTLIDGGSSFSSLNHFIVSALNDV